MDAIVASEKTDDFKPNTLEQLYWHNEPVSPAEYVRLMREHCPNELPKYWWHPKVWALLTDAEKGSMKNRVP